MSCKMNTPYSDVAGILLDMGLFNIIFETGIVPDNWLMGNIKPIYKNKGDKMDPKNYRPITILSCLGKLFTAVLSERLTKYSDDFFYSK